MTKEEWVILARQKLIAQDKPIEVGWQGFSRLAVTGHEARCRMLYYAGVKYMWSMIGIFLNEEITNEEEANAVKISLDRVEYELDAVVAELSKEMVAAGMGG